MWIVSLFILAAYLIFVEYGDYKLQEKLNELVDREDAGVEGLLEPGILDVEGSIRNVAKKVDETFCIKEEGGEKNEEHN